ncbi:protein SRG1-like isoform X2 [Mercurialis annua]|uniref:protein SRG1-like isoform X2 n=1 Tax=Mercurialis annua TaxID=3986 RepID=UPI0024AEBD55|nr:protein SRG1-like isoform X2 [Mercurialis annua]
MAAYSYYCQLDYSWIIATINHGISSSFLDKVRSDAEQFFGLPLKEKQKYGREGDSIEGYGNDVIFSDDQMLDWNDRLYLIISPQDKRLLKFWPLNPATFRETLFEYTKKLQLLAEIVLKAMAMSLNLEENCFLDQCGENPMMRARFNYYPPCSKHHQVLGLKPHSDSSLITILLQDKEIEGLQILKDDEWFRVPIIPETLLINLGEQAELMSNGLFKSPVHRVVVNPDKGRFSQAVFYHPDPEKYIEPADGLVNETRPRLYNKVKNYFSNYARYYQQRKRLVDALKV